MADLDAERSPTGPSRHDARPAPAAGASPRTALGSPDMYRALLDNMTEGVSLSDESGLIVYTNPAEDALFGYAPGELVGLHVSVQNAYPEEANQRRVAEVIAHLKANGRWEGEWLNRRKDGAPFVTASRITAVEVNGRAHWLCVQRDVTAERQAEADRLEADLRLRESEARFRNFADHAPVMMWVTEASGACTYLNRAWYAFTGQSEAQAEGFGWLDATHPDDRAQAERVFVEANATRSAFRLEYRLRRADGAYRWAIDAAAPRFGPGGEFLGFIGSVIDIDERRELEERQREGEVRLRTLTNALPAFVWFATPDGELHYFNDRWYEYTGQTAEEALPNGWARTLHPDDAGRTATLWADARSRGTTYEIEVRYRRRDGAYRWYVARAEPLRDEAGAVTGWFGTSTDIHDRRTAEERRSFLLALADATRPLADADAVMRTATRMLGERLGATRVAYAEIDEAADRATVRGDWADGAAPSLPPALRLSDYGDRLVASLRSGATLRVADARTDERARVAADALDAIAARAVVAVPLIKDGALVASLDVHQDRPREWTDDEVELVEGVAERTWGALARVRAEAAVRESEARFRGVFESGVLGFTIFDARTGETLAINDRFLEMTGHDRADFDEGRWDWRDFTVEGYEPLDDAAIAQARERGWWEPYEKEYRRRDGTRFPVRISSAPMPGEPGRVVVGVEDVTAASAAEAELRESERRLQLAKQAAGIGVWDWDLATDAIAWSPELYDLLGIDPATPPDRLYQAWTEILHPEDREAADAAARASARTGEPLSVDFRVVRAGGEARWIRSQSTAVLDRDGRPARLIGINVDVTAQHRLEEELRKEAARLSTAVEERTRERNRVFELSNDLFAAAGFDGYLKTINPAWEKLLGYTEAELLARPFVELIHPDDHAAAAEVVAALAGGRVVRSFEDRLVRKDGEVAWIAWVAVAEGDRFYAVGRDITREREREEALRQAQKMEAMGQLTGGVAHDFNNLLTPIVGALDLLQRRGVGGEREQRLIAGAVQSADRAKTLVQRLLAFARRQPLQPTAVDVAALTRGMADLVASTTGPQIRVVVDAAGDLPAAKADPNQLEMAILNLAVNARDAMPDGGTLRITAAAEQVRPGHPSALRPGPYVRLSVADTGIGMDEATMARAVEPFFSTKGIGKGTGLGLSMVHGLASQLGGALTIQSRVGVGTNVELWLPASAAPAEAAEPSMEASPLRPGKGTALLVDDEDLVRMSTADMLADLGYAVVEASSAEEALRIAGGSLRIDLLVTDHLMPGMSGTDLARAIRARRPDCPILIVSGYAEAEGIAPDLPRLTKPFKNADLAASIAALGPA